MRNVIWTALVAGFVMMALPAAAQTNVAGGIDIEEIAPLKDGNTYTYAAKFVCGTISPDGPAATNVQLPDPQATFAFVPGAYLTGINLLNTSGKTIDVVKFVTPTPPEWFVNTAPVNIQPLLAPHPKVQETLEPFFGFEVDCRDIVGIAALGIPSLLDYQGLIPPLELDDDFISGFVTIQSRVPLKVTAVYTYKAQLPVP